MKTTVRAPKSGNLALARGDGEIGRRAIPGPHIHPLPISPSPPADPGGAWGSQWCLELGVRITPSNPLALRHGPHLSFRFLPLPTFIEAVRALSELLRHRFDRPADDLAFERVVNVPKRGLADATLNALFGHARRARISLMARTPSVLGGRDRNQRQHRNKQRRKARAGHPYHRA